MGHMSIIAALGGLLFLAVPLCAIVIGIRRIVISSRAAYRSLARPKKPKAPKPLSNVEAARQRAADRFARRAPSVV